jgi:VPDSG-CTERM motif
MSRARFGESAVYQPSQKPLTASADILRKERCGLCCFISPVMIPTFLSSSKRASACIAVCAFSLMAALSAVAGPVNLIANGSFEMPAQQDDGVYAGTVPEDWTYTKTGSISLIKGDAPNTPGPEDGSQFVFLSDKAGISENISVPEAGKYLLDLYAAAQSRSMPGYLLVNITNSGDKVISQAINSTSWNDYAVEVTLAAGANLVDIQEQAAGRGIFVDNVVLQSTAAVPDGGSTLFMCGLVLGCLAAWRARLWPRKDGLRQGCSTSARVS